MSIFDHNVNDSMDKMFDLNNDGKIDSGEQSFMYEAYDKTINKQTDDNSHSGERKSSLSGDDSMIMGIIYIAAAVIIFAIIVISVF